MTQTNHTATTPSRPDLLKCPDWCVGDAHSYVDGEAEYYRHMTAHRGSHDVEVWLTTDFSGRIISEPAIYLTPRNEAAEELIGPAEAIILAETLAMVARYATAVQEGR